jgi:alpha-tubulin suppressor-like RCC1 family protein
MLKKSLLVTALALTSFSAFASSYFVVVPVPSRTTASNIEVSLSASALPSGLVGQPYAGANLKSLLAVTGDATYTGYGVRWSVTAGSLPAGLTLNSDGTLSGTPTAGGTSSFQVMASYKTKAGQQGYQIYVASITVALAAGAPPQAIAGEAYSYDLRSFLSVTGDAAYNGTGVTWSVVSSTLPDGLYLTNDGWIGGTPTTAASGSVTARATYRGINGQQSYQVVTLNISVSLASATLPAARANAAYTPYDFKSQLSVSGDNSFDASKASFTATGLPAGMTVSADGLLSGTPSTRNDAGASFQVVASYRSKTGQQVYTLSVNGAPIQAVQLATGGHHTCVVTPSGSVQCWGSNGYGQLGNGSTTDSLVPVTVVGLPGPVTSITAGYYHTCALVNGGAYCWGNNGYGQLGNNSTASSSLPSQVSGLASGVSTLSAGYYHTCATVNSAAKCWGLNGNYQLGDNTLTNSSVPVQVSGLTSGVSQVAGTWYHSCAIVSGGGLKCWGAGASGQLGNGATSQSGVPVQVTGLTAGVTSFALGANFTCAVVNGGASCWGLNSSGQLGNGGTTNSNVPVPVSGLGAGVTNISAGNIHVCAAANGAAKCWGYNNWGQVGNNTTSNTPLPSTVVGLGAGVTRVLAGYYFTCAQMSGGGLKCWGDNTTGALGDGTVNSSSVPVDALAP